MLSRTLKNYLAKIIILILALTANSAQAARLRIDSNAGINKLVSTANKTNLQSIDGYLAAFYIDHLDHNLQTGKAEMLYKLNLKNGKSIKLRFLNPPKDPGKIDAINIKGYKDGDDFVVESYKELQPKNKALLIGTSQAESSGLQTTLVARVIDSSRSLSSPIHSAAELTTAFFSSTQPSLNSYYKEVSKNRTSFTGNVINSLNVSNMCAGGNIFAEGGEVKALNAILSAGHNLKAYNRLSLIVPDDSFCLPSGVAGIGSVGMFTLSFTDGSSHRISLNVIKSTIATSSEDYILQEVVFHEFGHNFGLKHDNANVCGEDIYTIRCASLEYGGAHSIMGFAPTLAHLNAIHQNDLGWFTSTEFRDLSSTATINEVFTISPISETSTSLKSVRIPLGDGTYYVIEYRQAENYDAITLLPGLSSERGGILIYHNDDEAISNSSLLASDMIDRRSGLSQTSSGSYFDLNLAITFNRLAPFNNVFYDDINGIRVTPITLSTTGASFRVETQLSSAGGGAPPAETPVETPVEINDVDWTIHLPNSPQTLKIQSFHIDKDLFAADIEDDNIDRVEWDFEDDGVVDLVNSSSVYTSHIYREAGGYLVVATIYFNDGSSIEVTSQPLDVSKYLGTSLRAPGTTTASENRLKAQKVSKYIFEIENTQSRNLNLKVKPRFSYYKRFVKLNTKRFKLARGASKKLIVNFASDRKFRNNGLNVNDDGYYEIPLSIIEYNGSSRTYNYPVLLIKPAA
jgi:PKD repeat protein